VENNTGYWWDLRVNPPAQSHTSVAVLTVRPTITLTGPASQTVCNEGTALFSVTPVDATTYNYKWQLLIGSTWTDIAGATNPSYSFTALEADNNKQYRVLVSYKATPFCEVTSSVATLTVRPTIILTGPASQTVCEGTSATFSVTASASPPNTYNYQWQVNSDSGWSDILGATSSSYSLIGTSANNGYQYRVLVSYDTEGSCQQESNAADLIVQENAIAVAGRPQTICSDGMVELAGTASNWHTVTWSGGAGSFDPNANTLDAHYTPSAAEVALGSVTLTLTATPNAPCSASATSQVTITIEPKPDAKILVIEPVSVI
jgi:hypothetical protein